MLNKKYFYLLLIIIELHLISYVNAKVIVSIKPLGFIVSAITDNVFPTEVLLPYGESEHNYILKPSDLKKIKNSEILIWIGPEIEKFLIKPASFIARNNLALSSISQIKKSIIYFSNKKNFYKNMHLWLSPKLAKIFSFVIYKKLSTLFPSEKEKLFINLKNFQKQLIILDKKIFNKLNFIKKNRYFIFHDAFTYFEKYYGLVPIGFITKNPLIQPGIKKLKNIKEQIVLNNVHCIFSEPQYKNNFIKKLYNNSIKQVILDPLGSSITLNKNSYTNFFLQLSDNYINCLE